MARQIKIIDIMDDETIPSKIRNAIWDFVERGQSNKTDLLLVRSPENNDKNGSQHHNIQINFGYNDASIDDIRNAKTLGAYDCFASRSGNDYGVNTEEGKYSGMQYEVAGTVFSGLVINPPAYTVTSTIPEEDTQTF